MKFQVVRREGRGGAAADADGAIDRAGMMYERLAEMYEENGESLMAGDIVAEAQDEDSVFHDWFEWDDSEAARMHRPKQARDLIGSVDIVRKDDPRADSDGRIRAFVNIQRHVEGEDGSWRIERTYVPTVTAMADEEQRAQMLRQALSDFKNLERKYGALNELATIFDTVADVRETLVVTVE